MISGLTFVAGQMWNRRAADDSYVQSLERRVKSLEDENSGYKDKLIESERERRRLVSENTDLMVRLLRVTPGGHDI